MDRLKESRLATEKIKQKQFSEDVLARMIHSYNEADKRLFLLDYDGTLVDFQDDPQKVSPDEYLYNLLKKLSDNQDNSVVVISGRDKNSLERWLGKLNIGIVAEHGVWSKEPGQEWVQANLLEQEWKEELQAVMETFVDRTPGTFIEVKDYSLVWHYRKADQGLAEMRTHELIDTLAQYTSKMRLQILEGNKVIEIKNAGINKGHAASRWAERNPDSFILAAGDDYTDEDTFKAVSAYTNAFTIKVGHNQTAAHYNVDANRDVLRILHVLSEQQGISSDYKAFNMTA
jgi:trehalose 6-phosphate synthase/phosphatase